MGLAEAFSELVDSLPGDWTALDPALRISRESRSADPPVLPVNCNPQPSPRHDWHWRLLVAHAFGHAASAPTVHGTLKLLDDAEIEGELALREVREGRGGGQPMWGPPAAGPQGVLKRRAAEAPPA